MKICIDDLRRVLSEFVESVLARLDAMSVDPTESEELRQYWRSAQDRSDRTFLASRFAARLGVHWWSASASERHSLAELGQRQLDPIAIAGLEEAGVDGFEAWVQRSTELWNRCQTADSARPEWEELRRVIQSLTTSASHGDSPWRRGWDAAIRLRQSAGLASDRVVDTASFVAAIGVIHASLDATDAKSIIAWSGGRTPLIARRSAEPSIARFAEARDLLPLLLSSSSERDFGCVLSDRIAGLLPVANAFAAELLAPIERIRSAVAGRDRLGSLDVSTIAAEIDAPAMCVLHQVENHELAEVVP